MYTVTVNISARGTDLLNEDGQSVTGHMWYSISNGSSTESYGFAPVEHGNPIGQGMVYTTDDTNYASTYYTGTIVINQWQYDKLVAFGDTSNLDNIAPYYFDFSSYYNGLTNSCIDYTWKALNIIGLNPSDFEGQIWPTHNADDADAALYKYLFGNTSGWDKSLPDAGNYDVIYGSKNNDDLRSHNNTDAVYGGGGNDNIYGNNSNEKLFGGTGNDTYYAGVNDVITDTDGLGSVYFAGDLITGTEAKMTDKSGYIYKDANYTYKLTNPNGIGKLQILKNGSTSQTLLIDNFNATADEYLGIKLDKTPPQKDVTVDISNYSNVKEGDNGIKYMTFTVKSLQTLQSNESITLNLFIDSDSDADTNDYGSLSQNTVTLNSSKQSHEVTLEIKGDTQVEKDVNLQDIELIFDSKITTIDTSTIPDYTEYPESNTLPFLRGYGVNIAYNFDSREVA